MNGSVDFPEDGREKVIAIRIAPWYKNLPNTTRTMTYIEFIIEFHLYTQDQLEAEMDYAVKHNIVPFERVSGILTTIGNVSLVDLFFENLEYKNKYLELMSKYNDLKKELGNYKRLIKDYEARIQGLNNTISLKESEISALNDEIMVLRSKIANYQRNEKALLGVITGLIIVLLVVVVRYHHLKTIMRGEL